MLTYAYGLFFAHGGTTSSRIRRRRLQTTRWVLQAFDPLLLNAGSRCPRNDSGRDVLDGSLDVVKTGNPKSEADDPDGDGVRNEIPTSLVDFMEFHISLTTSNRVSTGKPR
jgi:hypothetical protein